jgi:hypothetical protein
MTADPERDLQLEVGHVLLIDIVGYTKLLITEQREQLRALNEIVRNTAQFRASDARGMLVRIPAGDGMALIFRDAVEAPLRCAVEISHAVKTRVCSFVDGTTEGYRGGGINNPIMAKA